MKMLNFRRKRGPVKVFNEDTEKDGSQEDEEEKD